MCVCVICIFNPFDAGKRTLEIIINRRVFNGKSERRDDDMMQTKIPQRQKLFLKSGIQITNDIRNNN